MRDFTSYVRRHLQRSSLPDDDARARRYDDIVEELASELEARYTSRLQRGESEEDAWNAAIAQIPSWPALAHDLQLAGRELSQEDNRTSFRRWRRLNPFIADRWTRDLRLGFRVLWKDRGFTAAAIVTLAICLGGHAAILSAVNATLFHPLRVPEPERIFLMANQYPRMESQRVGLVSATPDYEDRRQHVAALEDQAMYNFSDGTIESAGIPTRVRGIVGTPSLLRLLRARPAYGRLFIETEGIIGNDQKILLADGLWRELYGSDPAVVGQSLRLSGRDLTIVGVLEPSFSFGGPDVRFYIPFAFTDRQRSDEARHTNGWYSIGRLRSGATIEQARAQLSALDAANLDRPPAMKPLLQNAGYFTSIEPLQDVVVRDVRGPLRLLWGAALVVLVIGMTNVAGLVIARSRTRLSELGTRLALGASRTDLLRQLVVEGMIVAWAAMCGGVLLAYWLLSSFRASFLAGREAPHLDLLTVAITAAAAALAGALIGSTAALPLVTSTPGALLQRGRRTDTRGRASRATRRSLVVVQMACAFVLLVGAGLLWASLRNLLAVDTGFKVDGVITAAMSLPNHRYTTADDTRGFVNRSLETIRGLPGVAAAGATTIVPMGGNYQSGIIVAEGYIPKPGEPAVSSIRIGVTPGFFEAVGTPLVTGRYFDERDNDPGSTSIIIDERLAHRFWPGGDPIGRRMFRPENPRQLLTIDANTRWLTVVGVVGATKLRGPATEEVTTGTFYLPYAATAPRDFGYVIRSHAGTATVIGELRPALASLDREAPVFDVRTLEERTALSLMSRTSTMRIAVLFAVVAVFLSSVGLYGTLSYLVAQRRREFGVRLAIGSTPRLIVRLVLREGLVLAVAGVLIGAMASVAIRSLVSTQLYGIAASDPRVLAVTAVSLAAVALLASLLPAQRATRVDVMKILNAE
jgi:predicted permease